MNVLIVYHFDGMLRISVLGKCKHFRFGQCKHFRFGQCKHFRFGQCKHFRFGQCKHFRFGQCKLRPYSSSRNWEMTFSLTNLF
jgi:hypothetical protein